MKSQQNIFKIKKFHVLYTEKLDTVYITNVALNPATENDQHRKGEKLNNGEIQLLHQDLDNYFVKQQYENKKEQGKHRTVWKYEKFTLT